MPIVKCLNGNIIDVSESIAAGLLEQGHELVPEKSEAPRVAPKTSAHKA
jgi:hypothetical protein